MSYQTITIVGNVGNDAEMKYDKSGQAIVSFTVAVNKTTGKGEQRKQSTTWFSVTVWGERGENLQPYIVKGGLVLITGEVSANAWVDSKTGQVRAGLQIKAANDIRLLGSNRKDEQSQSVSNEPIYTDQDIVGEEIPF